MDPIQLLARVTFATIGTLFLVGLAINLVQYAKKASAGAYVLGTVFMLMGFGNMQDPTMEMVQQAKQVKKHEEDDSGDPPDIED